MAATSEMYSAWMENVDRRLRGETIRPLIIEIGLTNRCNLRCRYCYKHNLPTEDFSRELSDGEWMDVARDIVDLGPRHLIFCTAGESSLRFDLLSRMARVVKGAAEPIACCITTNGTLFTEATARELVKIGWDHITFSLDSPRASANDAQRCAGIVSMGRTEATFGKVLQSLKWFSTWKRRLGREVPRISFNAVITRNTWAHLDEFLDFAKGWGASGVTFFSLLDQSSAYPELRLSEHETEMFRRSIPGLVKKAERLGIPTNLREYLECGVLEHTNSMSASTLPQLAEPGQVQTGIYCYEPWKHMVIHPDGLVGTCFSKDIMFGDLREQSLGDIWEGDAFGMMRHRFLKGGRYPECDRCCAPIAIENNTLRSLFRQQASRR